MKSAVVFNLGCKVNQCECDSILTGLKQLGYDAKEELIPADLYVVNTCAVTAEAERKSRQIISRIKKLNPVAEIIFMGCAVQKNPKFYEDNNVRCYGGASGKEELLNHIGQKFVGSFDFPKEYEYSSWLPQGDRTRTYVKIQDGCNNFCSYCLIPYLRGRSRSRSVKSSRDEILKLSESTKEIVITGINLSAYGKDNGESLTDLIKAIKDCDARIRLGSFYVEGVDSELLDALFSLKHFCPHFHLSLQHGDNDVLKSMNRHYTAEEYSKKLELIRTYNTNSAITTDVIVGYPTETDTAFNNLKDFIIKEKFSDIHIFPYSRRDGTVGAKLKPLAVEIINKRKCELNDVKHKLRYGYLNSLIGVPQQVLLESDTLNSKIQSGYSEYYVRHYVSDANNNLVDVLPTKIYNDGLIGEIIYDKR